jgi:hypothetical protein
VQKPSLTASLKTSISAIQQAPPDPSAPLVPRSEIYHACQIAYQAVYVVNNKEIKIIERGNNQTHNKSFLNDTNLQHAIFQWASSQTIGLVSHLIPLVNTLSEILD